MLSLEEYAKKYPCEMTEKEKQISELEAQLWETDYRNDPAWVIKQNREHNTEILQKIRKLQED